MQRAIPTLSTAKRQEANSHKLPDALASLNGLIDDDGIEFPDAAYTASRRFDVDYVSLVAAYDNQFEGQ